MSSLSQLLAQFLEIDIFHSSWTTDIFKNLKNTFQITKQRKVNWKDVISLKHNAEEIWDTENTNTKRDWGKLLHLVLSKISYSNQKNEVINTMYALGKFNNEDHQELQNVVNNVGLDELFYLASYKNQYKQVNAIVSSKLRDLVK